MSANIFSRLALPDLAVTPDLMRLTDSKRRRLLRGIATLRRMAAAEIERLMDFLDRTEIDSDFEPAGDLEPALGAIEQIHGGQQLGWASGNSHDLEPDDDTGIADRDGLIEQLTGEATLGATEFQSSSDQLNWGAIEPTAMFCDGELEPELGSCECAGRESQAGWAAGAADHREGPYGGLE